jgi:hypothetical protein
MWLGMDGRGQMASVRLNQKLLVPAMVPDANGNGKMVENFWIKRQKKQIPPKIDKISKTNFFL